MGEFVKRLNETRLILPPLADYTDYPYRRILTEFNPGFICTEMVSPEAIRRKNPKTLNMLRMVPGGQLNGVQFIGADPESMGEAAGVIEDMGFDYIDINMGCTIKAVAKTGAGISLMSNEENALKIASSVVNAVGLPVSCKMRLGRTEHNKNAKDLSVKLEERGVAAITVHGRTGEKKFGLNLDHGGIRTVVESVEIPVIANGGVFSGEDAQFSLDETGASGVMPGRGLIGNPWIVKEISHTLTNTPYTGPDLDERKDVFLRHLGYLCDFYGERQGVISARRVIGKYFSSAVQISRLRLRSQKTESMDKMIALLDGLSEREGRVFYNG